MKIWIGAVLCLAVVHIAGATVINVDATKYGVQNWGQVGLDGWRYPYSGAPTLTVGAGTYTFSLVITNYLVFDQRGAGAGVAGAVRRRSARSAGGEATAGGPVSAHRCGGRPAAGTQP